MATKEKDLRAAIVAQCRLLSAAGLSPGTAGNISARLGEEATLLRLAAQLEQERPWKGKLPPVCA